MFTATTLDGEQIEFDFDDILIPDEDVAYIGGVPIRVSTIAAHRSPDADELAQDILDIVKAARKEIETDYAQTYREDAAQVVSNLLDVLGTALARHAQPDAEREQREKA